MEIERGKDERERENERERERERKDPYYGAQFETRSNNT